MVLVIPIHCVTSEYFDTNVVLQSLHNVLQHVGIAVTHLCQYIQTVLVSVVTHCIGITRTIPAFLCYRDIMKT